MAHGLAGRARSAATSLRYDFTLAPKRTQRSPVAQPAFGDTAASVRVGGPELRCRGDFGDDLVERGPGEGAEHVVVHGPAVRDARFVDGLGHGFAQVLDRGAATNGSVVKALTANGEPGLVTTYRHTTGDFLRAALPAGFLVRRCEEPRGVRAHDEPAPRRPTITDAAIGTWDDWPWSLLDVIPDAVQAAWATPSVIAWHFVLGSQRDS